MCFLTIAHTILEHIKMENKKVINKKLHKLNFKTNGAIHSHQKSQNSKVKNINKQRKNLVNKQIRKQEKNKGDTPLPGHFFR